MNSPLKADAKDIPIAVYIKRLSNVEVGPFALLRSSQRPFSPTDRTASPCPYI